MIKEINSACKTLQNKEVILYPTDTVWGIGCDATDFEAVSKVFTLKQRKESKSLVILVDSFEMLQQYIDGIPDKVEMILSLSKEPLTVIYNNPKNLAKNVISDNNTIAIRIIKDEFCQKLIQEFGKPIVSTSANISTRLAPKTFQQIEPSILQQVDYIVDLHKNKVCNKPSTIIKIEKDGSTTIIRE